MKPYPLPESKNLTLPATLPVDMDAVLCMALRKAPRLTVRPHLATERANIFCA
eukprot:CAMPEP_0173271686 /NCGR_PEP_ID=MMETSP1143-20121109/946_1 /TAXON_ID=483371 /ORGANISM="non described non described, Strain CCMP2298" /LENGTH=52 /DNA_ID=CAMNT_0014208261 /DNA_START=817 /DNA_END=971 /DNA_ORIENTATION=+